MRDSIVTDTNYLLGQIIEYVYISSRSDGTTSKCPPRHGRIVSVYHNEYGFTAFEVEDYANGEIFDAGSGWCRIIREPELSEIKAEYNIRDEVQ